MKRPQPAVAAPDFLRKWQVWSAMMVMLFFPFFIHIPRSLNHHPVISPLGDQVHIFMFAAICLMLYWFGPLQGRIWRAGAASAVAGGSVEFLQLLVHRQALFTDFLLDLVGIGLVTGFVYWRGHGRQAGKWVFVALLISIPVQLYFLPWRIAATYRGQNMFPVLATFESYGDRYLWSRNMTGRLAYPRIPDAPEGESHVLRITGDAESHWPGASMRRFPDDWSGYKQLKLEARLVEAAGDTAKFGVRLDDYEGIKKNMWVANSFAATRQWQTFTVPITDRPMLNGDRNLNLQEMDRLIIYLPKPRERTMIEIDNIRLE